ncbi:MAG: hypothetical protein CMK59_05375 [Proteobacteria bacterium]|nr:hypothetical protein [Pseudomonadota bacterium]
MNQFTTALLSVLCTILLVGTGWLMGQPAQAIPMGVDLGSNPLFSLAGSMNHSTSVDLGINNTHDRVITDVILTTASFCGSNGYQVTLSLNNGTQLGHFKLSSNYGNQSGNYQSNVIANLSSGIRVPVGESLNISNSSSYQDCLTGYTLVGYLARP